MGMRFHNPTALALESILGPNPLAKRPRLDSERPDAEPLDADAPEADGSGNGETPTRPRIILQAGEIHDAVDAAISVLSDPAVGVFQRGEAIVRPVRQRVMANTLTARPTGEANQPAGASVVVSQMDVDALVEVLTRQADFRKFDGRAKDYVPTNCPPEVARMVLARRGHGWSLPVLRSIVQAPTLRPDGTVLSEPGYDSASGLLLITDRQWPLVADSPSRKGALDALDLLREPLAQFPFVAPSDEAGALALLVTSVVRASLKTAPMFAVSAPSAGSGKSKIVDIAAVLATGRPAAVITPSADEAELEKRIGAAALSGEALISIDNVSSVLRSDMLCQLLTQAITEVRILGQSKSVKIANAALICTTGNNLAIFGDLNRRTVRIRLDAGVERPDERTFSFEPVAYAQKHRARLVAAVLTILRAYLSAGSPAPARSMGSFEEWSDLVRSALMWLGTDDPRGDVDEMRAEDPEKLALSEVLDALPTWQFSAKEIKQQFETDSDVRTALSRFADRGGNFSTTRFAAFLRRYKGTPVGGRKVVLVKADEKHGSLWRVENS